MPQAASMPDAVQEEDNRDILPAFVEDMKLREMKASFKSNKVALTRLSNQEKVRAETLWTAAQEQLQPMQETIERIYGHAQGQLGVGHPSPETGSIAPGAAKVCVRHDLKPWELSASATPSEFRRWKRKYEQYYLGPDIGVTNIPGQQATLSGCVDRKLEQHLYNSISDNTPIFAPEPNEDDIMSCMDIITDWITESSCSSSSKNEGNQLCSIPTASWTSQTSVT